MNPDATRRFVEQEIDTPFVFGGAEIDDVGRAGFLSPEIHIEGARLVHFGLEGKVHFLGGGSNAGTGE